jgi:hypothetical protein
MYWLLLDVLTFTIKLYVKFCKEKLELQAEVDAIEEMDMRTKVKQLGMQTRYHKPQLPPWVIVY